MPTQAIKTAAAIKAGLFKSEAPKNFIYSLLYHYDLRSTFVYHRLRMGNQWYCTQMFAYSAIREIFCTKAQKRPLAYRYTKSLVIILIDLAGTEHSRLPSWRCCASLGNRAMYYSLLTYSLYHRYAKLSRDFLSICMVAQFWQRELVIIDKNRNAELGIRNAELEMRN